MSSLKSTLQSLAATFATGVFAAIRSASLEEVLAEEGVKPGPGRPRESAATATRSAAPARAAKPAKTGKGGRLARRSASDIEHVIGLIVAKLGENKGGLRSEQLQKLLQLDKKEVARPLEQALAAKKISKKGERRATTYFAA